MIKIKIINFACSNTYAVCAFIHDSRGMRTVNATKRLVPRT